MRLNFFFDIDGTLLPFGKRVPESALEAIKSAKESGDRIFLSTGRSIAEISDEIASLPLNGGVYSAGGRAYADGKLLYKRVFTSEERREALDAIEKFNLEGVIQTDEGTYFKKESLELFKNLMMEYVGNVIEIPHAAVVDELSEELEMNKFLIISKERRVQEVREALKGKFVVVDNTVGLPQDLMAEVVLPDITKATGIEKILEYYGDSRDSVIAVGDGANDIEMIEYAAIGISMGNGSDSLKAVADYITTDVECDGLKNALEYAKRVKG